MKGLFSVACDLSVKTRNDMMITTHIRDHYSDSGSPLLGQVWPDNFTYFPDFSSPITQQWWIDQILDFHNTIKFDGIWIDMNEPASFVVGSVHGCPNNSLNYPPYKPYTDGPDLLQKTICLGKSCLLFFGCFNKCIFLLLKINL